MPPREVHDAFACDAEVESLACALLDLTLPKSQWTHAAHFAVAIWLLRRWDDFSWQRDMPRVIRRYNEAMGNQNTDTSGYHETITFASMRVAQHFADSASRCAPTFEIVNALLRTRFGGKDWLLDHWSHATLFSVAARTRWVGPDLSPLPF
ncbi:hypothetical protein EAH79_11660 [Sphingomonas koreensis]|nr:hypothetical protein EAH79_11660 [Sphingomonas koreensis]